MNEKISHFKIGEIVNTQGLRGEVRVYPFTGDINRFDELESFYLGKDLETKWFVEKVRYKGNMVIMKIKGIDTVEAAEKLKNKFMYISREESRELEDGEFFIADMIGMKVFTVGGEYVGELKEVLQYSANDVYVIKGEEEKEYTIPAIMKFVPTIDIEERKMIIDPIKGMLD
ncbi:ribosome maturation factor RimM [Asaccharospora irregularis]|uniref:Ribosome maturation factor RimM n=1 Tax=Asaccharospora irregularis DSM 2635 TaxID=1121321 RepID=A0A1M5K488_9FIRM|nr:ribosome maturation factor RimM [Asaccharospora irregularis]SHG47093.1 16S rRNA processing protein RimM [Asaccharospora irregularis DSM 2635]